MYNALVKKLSLSIYNGIVDTNMLGEISRRLGIDKKLHGYPPPLLLHISEILLNRRKTNE